MCRPFDQAESLKRRSVVTGLATLLALVLACWDGMARAQQAGDDSKKGETSSELLVPPPMKPEDDQWLSVEFDRLRLAVDNVNFPDRVNVIAKNDKNGDKKLSPEEWP